MRCRDAANRITDYMENAGGAVFRWRMRGHLRDCPHCSVLREQLRVTRVALSGLARGEVDPGQRALALLAFREARAGWRTAGSSVAVPAASRAGAGPWRIAAAVAATALSAVLSALVARPHLAVPRTWIEATLFALAASALTGLAWRRGLLAGALALAAAGGLVLLTPPGALEAGAGLRCAAHEALTAVIPVAVLAWGLRGGALFARATVIGAAAAGALAGDAVLHVTCPAGGSQLHALVFHLGGVIVSATVLGIVAGQVLRLGNRTA